MKSYCPIFSINLTNELVVGKKYVYPCVSKTGRYEWRETTTGSHPVITPLFLYSRCVCVSLDWLPRPELRNGEFSLRMTKVHAQTCFEVQKS